MSEVIPFSLKDAPALIERLLPVQKLSAEAYKEQMAGSGKTLTALGSYWKGRKPLVLNKACILGCLLPATKDLRRDLEIFEKLMAMDDESFVVRWPRRPRPREILATLSMAPIRDFFTADRPSLLPETSPVDWTQPQLQSLKVDWREDVGEMERRRIEAQMLRFNETTYRERVEKAQRAEEVADTVHDHIWDGVNAHLGTQARSMTELVEQLGMMRFGRRARVADTFCGSGQIPFEAARLGCDVYASDLNPIACLLTWGALNIVGGGDAAREKLLKDQGALSLNVGTKIDDLGVETDGNGWVPRVFLHCTEVRCPQTGWMVPLLPTRLLSTSRSTIVEMVPDPTNKRYDLLVRSGVNAVELAGAKLGTIGREGKYGESFFSHCVNGTAHKTKISTLRGDYKGSDGTVTNRVRAWEKQDFKPRPDDVFQERLYCVQWMRRKPNGQGYSYEFRSVTEDDLRRESVIEEYLAGHLAEWQGKGWVPDMRIEVGGPPRYQGLDLIRARGWTHWHHVFTPRSLLIGGLIRQAITGNTALGLMALLNCNSKLSRWNAARDCVAETFDNQALNTLFNYASQSFAYGSRYFGDRFRTFPLTSRIALHAGPAIDQRNETDIYITDPPYGDAVKYEEILDFFVAWLRKNPPPEFANWVWDSRRSLAIKGEDEDFRRGMVGAYKQMTECMADNGLQVIMFTHQSGSIWADMANIVWASGLQVTAAWYVVTETDSPLREGSYVKGTVVLVLRKRRGIPKTTRDDLAWEIQEEVEKQVLALTGLNQAAKDLYRAENVFEDADIQMAGYAAALRVLTRYATIDGRDMTSEASRPRIKGEITFVDGLIKFAVDTANQCLVPQGISKSLWDRLSGAERFYLKLTDLESKGLKTLENYQNFAKAFKVREFRALMGSHKANAARLKTAAEFGRTEMSEGSELYTSVLRAVLYGLMELATDTDGNEVIAHLTFNVPNYYSDMTQRQAVVEISDYLAGKLEALRPAEASAARVLRDLVKNQRLG
jgi:putative DNA methylase